MVALRSRRLETALGASLDALEPGHVHGLVAANVQEAFDLDFKQALYGRGDSDKRALAGDVAALANTGGGLIVIGIEEDAQARAVAAPGVDITDAEVARMRQAIASNTAPMPAFDILTVEDSGMGVAADGTARGFIVVAVPRSPGAPHAVLVNDALRYPTRNGATTRYLSEPEVATAYRNRYAAAQRQADRIEAIEREAIERLDLDDHYSWAVVSLVPDLPGDLTLTQEVFRAFELEARRGWPTITNEGFSVNRTRVGRRRLLADGTSDYRPQARRISMELHTDGSGVFAVGLGNLNRRDSGPRTASGDSPEADFRLVVDEAIASVILSGLVRLGQHARDRAAAGGTALIRAQVVPVDELRPTAIGHNRSFGFGESRTGDEYQTDVAQAEAAAALEDLAAPGSQLVAAAALLLDELGQAFGVPEMGQVTRDGRIRRPYWGTSTGRRQAIEKWAADHGIEVVDEVIPY